MYKLKTILIIIFSWLFLVSCAGQEQTGNDILIIGLTPNLSSFGSSIYKCSPTIKPSVRVDALPLGSLLTEQYDTVIQVGLPDTGRIFPLQVGSVKLVFIINHQNPLTQLSSSEIEAILLGLVDDWHSIAPSGFSTPTTINLWSYPAGDDIKKMVELLLLDGRQITSRINTAPDSGAMTEAVNHDPAAIGYLLDINPQKDTKVLQINPSNGVSLEQPVIASFTTIPEGDLKVLMACLSKQKP